MQIKSHFTLPAMLIGTAAAASIFAFIVAGSLRHSRKGQQKHKPALARWEDEGGSVATPVGASP